METTASEQLDVRIARRLLQLRSDHGWSLEVLAERTGISRSSLSRLERGELSPTAAMLGSICSAYGWTLSRLMADAEGPAASLVATGDQLQWTDPGTGYRRRAVSPPATGMRGELVEVHIPAGATVAFDRSPVAGLEHHLWLLEGSLTVEVEGSPYTLQAGDTLRYVLSGATRFTTDIGARYVVAMVHP